MNKTNEEYFEVKCSINYGKGVSLKIPMQVRDDFERTVESGDDKLMSRLVELFAEYELLDEPRQKAFQALILLRSKETRTLDDLLEYMKAIRLCTAFFEEE